MNLNIKKINTAIGLQIALLVLGVLSLFIVIPLFVSYIGYALSIASSKGDTAGDIDALMSKMVAFVIATSVFSLVYFAVLIPAVIYVILSATLPDKSFEYNNAKTLIWIGFGLSFLIGFIGNIITLVGLVKAKKVFMQKQPEIF
ncbi:hypothetical protein [Mycoplasma seminis]|uniref:DUF996 domain-containing protein n=1 Tax=Mycoplasma seminis TaxID=512749 RepID=A0ABY9H9W5_9MOLU|nr:hypothetical protein [Mycoplasma seminis]WLP85388.1 hypothetical protein Q8852_03645 [Mycoplasma seminis]